MENKNEHEQEKERSEKRDRKFLTFILGLLCLLVLLISFNSIYLEGVKNGIKLCEEVYQLGYFSYSSESQE